MLACISSGLVFMLLDMYNKLNELVEVMSHGVDRCDIFWVNVEIVVLQAIVQSPYHVACNTVSTYM